MKENGIVYEEPPYNWTNNMFLECHFSQIYLHSALENISKNKLLTK